MQGSRGWEEQPGPPNLQLELAQGPQACERPGPSGSQTLGLPGATGCRKRAKNRVGARGLGVARGIGKNRGASAGPGVGPCLGGDRLKAWC